MKAVKRASRLRAIRGALREAERHLVEDETVCVTLYQRLGVVDVVRQKGRAKKVLARFAWDTNAEGA